MWVFWIDVRFFSTGACGGSDSSKESSPSIREGWAGLLWIGNLLNLDANLLKPRSLSLSEGFGCGHHVVHGEAELLQTHRARRRGAEAVDGDGGTVQPGVFVPTEGA